jgi:glycosyltransferase involved in cell wall biosynthesis
VKKKILLLYPYYWPHYKAGGPVQSLFNLVSYFKSDADFFLISLVKDIDGGYTDDTIHSGFSKIGPNKETIFFVSRITPLTVLLVIRTIKPDVIFLNGLFNIHTTVPGLVFGKLYHAKIIISPRGMLQPWALKRSSFKKKIFLLFFRMILKKNQVWHATDEQEKRDIELNFGSQQQVHMALNIPRGCGQPVPLFWSKEKIKLVFLSLINPNKNLHLIIQLVNQYNGVFTLDIYGPIMDKAYWEVCQNLIVNNHVTYKGPVPPWQVPEILPAYHFFVLPTEGENFGHAIFDALASGVPVIISRNTPWTGIEGSCAGFYINLEEADSLAPVMDKVAKMSSEEYQKYRSGSFVYAKHYWDERTFGKDYNFLMENKIV